MHDLKNCLRRLEIMAELLERKDFKLVPREELLADLERDFRLLEKGFEELKASLNT